MRASGNPQRYISMIPRAYQLGYLGGLALSRLAARHGEVCRLRAAAFSPPGSSLRDLASRRAGT